MPQLPLNPSQREAVTTTGRPVLVLAGAGCGKTRVVAARIAHLIHKEGVKPTQILGVTFTNKAAKEMRDRVRCVVGARHAKGVTLSTFHALGCRVLRESIAHLGRPRNFSIYAMSEQLSLVTGIIRDIYGHRLALHPGTMLNRISTVKNRMETPDSFTPRHHDKYDEVLPTVYARYEQSLLACNAVDFDDLLFLVLRLFQTKPDILEQYRSKLRHVLIDEYQDTNHLQFELVEALAGDGSGLCVVGDDDQSIYAWRGADIQNILSFADRHKKCRRVTLDINYRSTNSILAAANSVIANNPGRHEKNLRSDLGAGVCIDVMRCRHESDEAVSVVERILYFKNRFDLAWRDFAILYRANGQAKPFERVLVQRRLPYRVIGGTELYDRKEVRDLVAYLQIATNPKDNLNLLRILNYPRRGIGDSSIEKVMAWSVQHQQPVEKALRAVEKIPGVSAEALGGIASFLERVDRFRKEAKSRGTGRVSALVRQVIEDTGLADELRSAHEPKERIQGRIRNLENLVAAAEGYEKETGARASAREFVAQVALLSAGDREKNSEEENPNLITLMTLHGAKGLEFPFVFLAGVEDGLLPHLRSMRDTGGIHEERRLFYVGMTRARRHLTLTHADERATENGAKNLPPSRFLREIPDEYLNVTHSSQGNNHCYLDAESASARVDFSGLLAELDKKQGTRQTQTSVA